MTLFILGIAVLVVVALISQPSEAQNEHDYSATFGTISDHFSSLNKGWAVGNVALSRQESFSNGIVIGQSGSGKSVSVIIQSIISIARGRSSMIINDCSGGELFKISSLYLQKRGYKVMRICFCNASISSVSFNPLSQIASVADAMRVATTIVQNTLPSTKSSDPFWSQSSAQMISIFIRYLKFHCDPKFATLQNVLRLAENFVGDSKSVDRLFITIRQRDESLYSNYRAMVASGDRTLQSIAATTRACLFLWQSESVCKTTAQTDFNFQMFRDEPCVLFLTCDIKDLDFVKPASSLLIGAMFDEALSRLPNKHERSCFFVLEEAGVTTISHLSTLISQCRKFLIGVILGIQDQKSLAGQYSEAEAAMIFTCCSLKVYLKGQGIETCQSLSKVLGRYTYEDERGKHTRELMAPEEIRVCEDAIVILGSHQAMRIPAIPYYQNLWTGGLQYARPLELPAIPEQELSLIQFA